MIETGQDRKNTRARRVLAVPVIVLVVSWTSVASAAKWKGGAGHWNDAARWEGTPPAVTVPAEINAGGRVVFDSADAAVSRLDLGTGPGSEGSLTVQGGALGVAEFIRLGEYPGSNGRLVLRDGSICTTEIGIGGMNEGEAGGAPANAELEIRGGIVITKYLMMGYRIGSIARLHVVGSKAAGIVVLSVFDCAIPSTSEGSTSEFHFDIDSQGVTPVDFQNRRDSIHLAHKDRATRCLLHIALLEAPPAGDIPFLLSHRPCVGTFHDLPEGSLVRSEHAGRTYEWRLTYRGGESKCDVMLTDPQLLTANGKTAYLDGQPARVVKVDAATIKAAWGKLFRHVDEALPPAGSGTPAFPGAEGCGAYSKGGRGGATLLVTNLNDAGPGSLRRAIDTKGPRTIVFRVGGVIELKSPLQVREPFVTIAGQTAPGDGICLKGSRDSLSLSNTHDVILRHLRVRTGYGGDAEANQGDCIACYNSQNFIIDHCSTSWGTDETISCTGTCDLYTVQWCILAEGLNCHRHSMGSILGGDRSSWHHNLFAHCNTRNPRFAGLCRSDFRNNVIYDWGSTAAYGDFRAVNYVNNYLKPGPSTRQKPPRFISGESYVLPGSLFARGNVMEGFVESSRDNRLGIGFDPETFSDGVLEITGAETQTAEIGFSRVLEGAGALLPCRDAIDGRILGDVRHGTGKIISRESDAGGFPVFAGGICAPDSDDDGIPDDWEKAHELDPHAPGDAALAGADGYTNLERYLNSIVPGKSKS